MRKRLNSTFVFRTDASIQIGSGHVMRCLTLADALAKKGAHCEFICREHPGHLITYIRNKGYKVHSLAMSREADADLAHSVWLGATQVHDANACKKTLSQVSPDWLIVDHYALDARWERLLADTCDHVMVIDDLADRLHACDMLLDQNWFGDSTSTRYKHLVPIDCVCYLGPKYSLLKPEYARVREMQPSRGGSVNKVLVFLGGSDSSNQTAKVLDALSFPELLHLRVDIVFGQNHPDIEGISKRALARGDTELYENLPTLAHLMASADLMIGAGGSTNWERMCLGLPSIVISIANNQNAANISLKNSGYIEFLGEADTVTASTIAEAVLCCINEPTALLTQSIRAQKLVDGKGAEIICQELLLF